MGEQNANSAITMRMTRMARKRKDGTVPQALVDVLINRLTGVPLPESAADIAKSVVYNMSAPARTQREQNHMADDVPSEIGDVSKRVIAEVIGRGWGASYTVVDGDIWMVELVTSIDDDPATPAADRIEASVTWVNPDTRLDVDHS
jgi:hypothetical protein